MLVWRPNAAALHATRAQIDSMRTPPRRVETTIAAVLFRIGGRIDDENSCDPMSSFSIYVRDAPARETSDVSTGEPSPQLIGSREQNAPTFAWCRYGQPPERNPVARNGRDTHRDMAGRIVESASPRMGLLVFIARNLLWVTWGWHDKAYALIALQVGLFALNIRGARKSEQSASGGRKSKAAKREDMTSPPGAAPTR